MVDSDPADSSPADGRDAPSSASRLRRLESLFDVAAELTPAERDDYLDAHCPPELREELEELLALDDADRPELRGTHPGVRPLRSSTLGSHPPTGGDASPPSRIGPYRLHELLGEGGMGQVYRAEQSEPVERTVALKIIRAGVGNQEILRRFDAEKQTLARMNHPSIAKVLDAGTTDDGTPYFVMELVDGIPIHRYCEKHHLSPRARIELFIRVLKAVEHAHQKGVIHRDLKPSNILITHTGDEPHPVVIDFGIAKAVDHARGDDPAVVTQAHQFLGTPEYMSPEQASLSHRDIDTRTDIYALGIVLYELLTGSTPFEPEFLREAGLLEVLRIIREVDPPRPSTRVTTKRTTQPLPAERRTELKTLGRLIRGDLDWIVMKCLEKERDRRYRGASELIEDLERHLHYEPVLAGPPSRWYRTRRFVRKHRLAVGAGTVAVTALIVGLVVSLSLYFETLDAKKTADLAKDAAIDAKTEAEEAADRERRAADVARAEAKKARQASAFLLGTLESADVTRDGRDVRLTTILDRARNDLTRPFEDPELEAALYRTLAVTYRSLGLVRDAEELLRLPLAEAGSYSRGEEIELRLELAWTLLDQGRLEDAGSELDRIENDLEQLGNDPTLAARPTLEPRAIVTRSRWHRARGEFARAETLLPAGLEGLRATLGDSDDLTQWANEEHVQLLDELGHRDRAIELLTQLTAAYERSLGVHHSVTLRAKNDLAHHVGLADPDRAEAIFREILAIQRDRLGELHPDTLQTVNNLAVNCWSRGKLDEAEELYVAAWRGFERTLGRDHPHTLNEMNNLAVLYTKKRRLDDARTILRQALARHEESPEPHRRLELATRHSLAEALFVGRDYARAAEIASAVAEEAQTVHPDDSFRLAVYRGTYGKCLRYQHEFERAEPELLASAHLLDAELGPEHPYTVEALYQLTRLYTEWGRPNDLRRLEERVRSHDLASPKTPRD